MASLGVLPSRYGHRKTKNTREIEDSIVDWFMLVEELVYTCKRDELVLEDRFIFRGFSLIERGAKEVG